MLHTSASDPNDDGTRRARLIIVLDNPIEPQSFARVRQATIELFDLQGVDPVVKDIARLYYLGKVADTPDREVHFLNGQPLPVGDLPLPPIPEVAIPLPGTRKQATSTTPYGLRALENECEKVKAALPGKQNHTLNAAAYAIGQLIAGGEVLESDATQCLVAAGMLMLNDPKRNAWTESDVTSVVVRGIADGNNQPRSAPPNEVSAWSLWGPANDEAEPEVYDLAACKRTELGNAERLLMRYGNVIRYCPPRRKWLLWDGRRWAWDDREVVVRLGQETARKLWDEAELVDPDDKEIRKAIISHARSSEKRAQIDAMIGLARTKDPVLLTELDNDPNVLSCQNGLLDLSTGILIPPSRDHLITKIAGASYYPDAKHNLWFSFLQSITNGDTELEAFLQRAVGYALSGRVTEKAFFFLHGPPDGGKSTFIDAVAGTFGDHHESAAFSTWLNQTYTGGNRGDLVRLAGTRLVTSVETRPNVRFDQEIIKKVTGGDMLTCAAKYEAEVSFPPTFALWLAANDAPMIQDDDAGMWNRLRRIPFTNVIPASKQDKQLRAKLATPDVRAAILAWAVQGVHAWQANGLGSCEAVNKSNEAYRIDMDRCAGFFEECLVFEANATMTNQVLGLVYETYCRENGIPPHQVLTRKALGLRLKERGCVMSKDGKGMRGWLGVKRLGT
jgi:putative DNA primase/helicase